MNAPRGDSDVRIFDGAGRPIGTVDCVTRERRDASGRGRTAPPRRYPGSGRRGR